MVGKACPGKGQTEYLLRACVEQGPGAGIHRRTGCENIIDNQDSSCSKKGSTCLESIHNVEPAILSGKPYLGRYFAGFSQQERLEWYTHAECQRPGQHGGLVETALAQASLAERDAGDHIDHPAEVEQTLKHLAAQRFAKADIEAVFQAVDSFASDASIRAYGSCGSKNRRRG